MKRPVVLLLSLHMAHAFAVRRLTRTDARGGRLFPQKHKKPWHAPMYATIDELEASVADEHIDEVIDQISGVHGGNIIRPYKPDRLWLWRRWSGTLLAHGLKTTFFNMCISVAIIVVIRKVTGGSWALGVEPDASHPVVARLAVFDKAWHYLMTLTTFILTFFVGQAYALWRDVYNAGRKIQGRLNDISLLLATHAKRDKSGIYTTEAESLLDDVGSYSRAFHALFWAGCSRRFRVLLAPRGLARMVSRGILTRGQKETLTKLDLPPTQRYNACLEWMLMRIKEGMKDKSIVGGSGLEYLLLEKFCTLRGVYAGIADTLDGRMPLAYAHLVQLLVDTFLFCAPFALYAELGVFSVFPVGMLTLFYLGLLDLAKVLLDPLDNEDYCHESVNMDLGVLIRESNAGSIRWKNGAATLPF